jgi:pectate lyase
MFKSRGSHVFLMGARVSPLIRILACAPVLACAARGQGAPGAVTPGRGAGAAASTNVAVGWASMTDFGQPGTNGGGAATPVEISDATDFEHAVDGDNAAVVRVVGRIEGSFEIGSNKTIEGAPGAEVLGHLELAGSANVIVRNLRIIGLNCGDAAECKHGADAVTMKNGAHHVWFDHCDISDGSDGNLDIVDGSDYVTISWTKFSYSGRRSGDHQFSNLIGSSDSAGSVDAGHLRITFDHCWWADNVDQRMPRVRFGLVHIVNSLYTARGNSYCIGLGADANILVENSAFIGVKNPVLAYKYATAASVLVSRGNLYEDSGVAEEKAGAVFTPPYHYVLDAAATVPKSVMAGAGPH